MIGRDVIALGVFTSVKDLARKLRRYINAYSSNAKPTQWRYSDPTRRKSNRPRLDFISSTETTGTDLVVAAGDQHHCSRHQCPHWRRREQDFGGVVEA